MKFENSKDLFSFKNLYWFYIVLMGLVFTFLVPPFQKLDEHTHYNRVLSISDGQLFCGTNKQFDINAGEYDLQNEMQFFEIVHDYEKKFPIYLIHFKENNREDRVPLGMNACLQNFVGYLPNVLGIFVGRIFKLPLLSFYLARLSGFLFFIFCMYLSLNLFKGNIYYWIVLLFGLFIKVIFQVTTISYDVVQLSLTPLFFSLFIRLVTKSNNEKRDRFLLGILLIVNYVFVKPGYYLLILLYILTFKKYSKKEVVNVIIFLCATFLSFIVYYFTSRVGNFNGDDFQMEFLKTNPVFFVTVIYRTTMESLPRYINEMIGSFGYNDYDLSSIVRYLYLIFLVNTFINLAKKGKKERINFGIIKVGILISMLIGTYVVLHFAMYSVWTPVGKNVVDGVQGRYFLPLLPYIFLIVIELCRRLNKKTNIQKIIVLLIFVIVIVDISVKIYKRFYD